MALREAASAFERLSALSSQKKQLVIELHQLTEQQTAVWHQFQVVQQQEDELMQQVGHLLMSVTGGPGMHGSSMQTMQEVELDSDPVWKKPRLDTAPLAANKADMMGPMAHRANQDLTPRAASSIVISREASPPQSQGYGFGGMMNNNSMWPSMHESISPQDIQQRNASMKEAQVRIAVQIKSSMPDPLENAQGGKNLLRSSVLAGQPLEYRKQGQAVGWGIVAHNNQGTVICKCPECKGRTEVSLSLFEAHSGSTLRRPAEFTFLSNFNISIKDLLTLVNSEEVVDRYSKCQLCRATGEELLRCDKCGCAFHAECLGFGSHGQEDPPCPACVQKASLFLNHGPPQIKYGPGMKTDGSKPTTPLYGMGPLSFPDDLNDSLMGNSVPMNKDASRVRNKRLFLAGSGLLHEGEKVKYVVGDKVMMEGTVCLGDATQPGGIRCNCCNNIISCSAFEQHAGYGSRRAPYDHIVTAKGISLKRLAEMGPDASIKMSTMPPGSMVHTSTALSQAAPPHSAMDIPSLQHMNPQQLAHSQRPHLINTHPQSQVMSPQQPEQHISPSLQGKLTQPPAQQHNSPPQPGVQNVSPPHHMQHQQQRAMAQQSQDLHPSEMTPRGPEMSTTSVGDATSQLLK